MKTIILKTFLALLICNYTIGQNMDIYNSFIKKGDSLYNLNDFKNAAVAYQNAFDANEGKAIPVDRYNAACVFALAGDSKKAFYHLVYAAEHPQIKYSNYGHLTTDPTLKALHKNKQWPKLLMIVQANKDEIEKNFDKPLIAILENVYDEDQKYRQQIEEVEKKYGRDSDEMKKHWELINKKDSINLIAVQKILDEKGWLAPTVIGNKGNATLFLVIQHSPLEFQEKYLPMMREAVKKGNANGSSLALLEDRVAIRKGGKQIYGSQIGRDAETDFFYVMPIDDPKNVDVRRKTVGLGTISEYISHWNLTWNAEKHIEASKKWEKK